MFVLFDVNDHVQWASEVLGFQLQYSGGDVFAHQIGHFILNCLTQIIAREIVSLYFCQVMSHNWIKLCYRYSANSKALPIFLPNIFMAGCSSESQVCFC